MEGHTRGPSPAGLRPYSHTEQTYEFLGSCEPLRSLMVLSIGRKLEFLWSCHLSLGLNCLVLSAASTRMRGLSPSGYGADLRALLGAALAVTGARAQAV